MKRIILILMVLPVIGAFTAVDTLVILPVGDSITQGGRKDRKEYTYRLPLQMILARHGINFDFIGSQKEGLHNDFDWPDIQKNVPFDPDHEGYYGNTTANVCKKAMQAFSIYKKTPDMVLIHLGTNDQNASNHKEAVGEPLRDYIAFLRSKNPNLIIFLGHLNFNGGGSAMQIREVVEQVATDLNTSESPVITVHHYENWHENPEHVYTDTYDWAHPNLKGQEKMAMKWFESMKPFLQ